MEIDMRKTIGALACALAAPATAAAQSADVTFSGNVNDACTVTAGSAGTLATNASTTVLASTEAGGSSGSASVSATSSTYNLNVSAPTAFDTEPTGGGTNVAFSASYDASGATVASSVTAGTPTALSSGITAVSVDATATKSSGIFPSGSYTMTTTVQCVSQ
jgi:hypothetical protein